MIFLALFSDNSYFSKQNLLLTFTLCILSLLSIPATATETEFWQKSNEASTQKINHDDWQYILDHYLVSKTANGVNLFKYSSVSVQDKEKLIAYLNQLQKTDPLLLNKAEQKAYWINLYNALTVQLIIKKYPVKSITKIGESFFSFGPWDDDAAKVNNEALSLNDIEHKILRPIFKDNRIHYAVNCASYSCPNLSSSAFTSENTDTLLDKGACDYINHSRGVNFNGDELLVSSIYHWYIEDFGGNTESLVQHLLSCAQPKLKDKLQTFLKNNGDISNHYDWSLNELK